MTAEEEKALKLENQLCFPLYAAARKVVGLYSPFLKPLGITYTQYLVFLVLWEQDNISVNELGKKLLLDNGTLTPLLKKMQAENYITRTRSSEDERVVVIALTEKGREMKEKCSSIPHSVGSCIRLERGQAELLYKTLYHLLEIT